MTEPAEEWAKRLEDLTGESGTEDHQDLAEFVQELYESAQRDLDDQRAQAEYEREE